MSFSNPKLVVCIDEIKDCITPNKRYSAYDENEKSYLIQNDKYYLLWLDKSNFIENTNCYKCKSYFDYYNGDRENPPESAICNIKGINFIPEGIQCEITNCDKFIFNS